MGVPITFLDKYNPDQLEILGLANSARYIGDYPCYTVIDGKKIYNRILMIRINANYLSEVFGFMPGVEIEVEYCKDGSIRIRHSDKSSIVTST